jgi:flagellar basal body-associated protein FliL
MKQKDLALIIVIVVVSAVVSLFLSRMLFASSSSRQQQAAIVPAISPTFPSPDTAYFNTSSVDPTQLIQVGNNNNTNPFDGSSE